MASKNHGAILLDMQNDDEDEINLQFQDFGTTNPSKGRDDDRSEHTIYFNSFPDSAQDDQEQKEPRYKKVKLEDKRLMKRDFSLLKGEDVEIKPIINQDMIIPSYVVLNVLEIKEKKYISKAVQEVSKFFPIPQLHHLKRVKKMTKDNKDYFYIYLNVGEDVECCVEGNSSNLYSVDESYANLIWRQLNSKGMDTQMFSGVFLSKGSQHPPRIRTVFDQVNSYWPCSFHEDLYLTKLISDSHFNAEETEHILKFATKAVELSQSVREGVGLRRAAVIARGSRYDSAELFWGTDRRYTNPLLHSSLVAIDAVARSQGGGALPPECHDNIFSEGKESKEAENVLLKGEEKGREVEISPEYLENRDSKGSKETENILLKEEGKTERVELSPKCHKDLVQKPEGNKEGGGHTQNEKTQDYICTGHDVYLTDEPCLMCAMALLHSRIQRVFYVRQNSGNGALNSVLKLHILPGINHRYEVFYIKLREDNLTG